MQTKRWAEAAAILLLETEARAVTRELARRGRRVLSLKGLAYAASIYGRDELRPLHDWDVLVAPADLPALRSVLEARGFHPQAHGQIVYARGGLSVDVHTELPHLRGRSLAAARARACPLGDGVLWGLAPEEALLYHVVHMVVQHGRLQPPWLEDLRRLWRALDDPRLLIVRARASGLVGALRIALEAALPGEAAKWRSALRQAGGDDLRHRLLRLHLRHVAGAWAQHRMLPLVDQRGPLAFLGARWLPDADFMRRRYDIPEGAAIWPWYLVRPCHWLGRRIRASMSAC